MRIIIAVTSREIGRIWSYKIIMWRAISKNFKEKLFLSSWERTNKCIIKREREIIIILVRKCIKMIVRKEGSLKDWKRTETKLTVRKQKIFSMTLISLKSEMRIAITIKIATSKNTLNQKRITIILWRFYPKFSKVCQWNFMNKKKKKNYLNQLISKRKKSILLRNWLHLFHHHHHLHPLRMFRDLSGKKVA